MRNQLLIYLFMGKRILSDILIPSERCITEQRTLKMYMQICTVVIIHFAKSEFKYQRVGHHWKMKQEKYIASIVLNY